MHIDYYKENIDVMTEVEIKTALIEFLQNHSKMKCQEYTPEDYFNENQHIYFNVVHTKKRKSLRMLLYRLIKG
ncbi:hypothetical protein DMO16_14880 [Fictibacillus sp. S7]|nr:hypothetical protein DMO16_14880 [Fictibacillus sp. S7]